MGNSVPIPEKKPKIKGGRIVSPAVNLSFLRCTLLLTLNLVLKKLRRRVCSVLYTYVAVFFLIKKLCCILMNEARVPPPISRKKKRIN